MASDKGLAILLGAGKPGEGDDEMGDDVMLGIAEDLIAAVKDRDAEAVATALRAAHDHCASGDDYDVEEDEE